MSERPEIRIGDAERDAAVHALGEHYAAGRLTKEEYDERADRAWAARTNSDLWPLFLDLPTPAVQQRRAAVQGYGRPGAAEAPADSAPGRRWWTVSWPLVLTLVLLIMVVGRFTPFPVFLLIGGLWFFGPWRRSGRRHH